MYDGEINNLADFISTITEIRKNHGASVLNSEQCMIYRGVSNYGLLLEPGVLRMPKYSLIEEHSMLTQFSKCSANYIEKFDKKDDKVLLELAQHYGVPTRLLDFTNNPLVALFFCCIDDENDGSVYVLNKVLYKMYINNEENIGKSTNIVINEILDYIQKGDITEGNGVLNVLENSCNIYPYIYIPYFLDRRMEAQSSIFMIWGSREDSLDQMLKGREFGVGKSLENDLYIKLRIRQSYKKIILEQLDECGINEKSLFPGLDGIGKYVKRTNKKNRQ